VRLILSTFFYELTDDEKSYEHFMEANTTAHTAKNAIDALDEVFGEQVISEDYGLSDHPV
jgi:hypothetical protein